MHGRNLVPTCVFCFCGVGFGPSWIAANGYRDRPWQDGSLAVAESTRHAYGLRDDTGRTMDGLQVMATKPLVL